MNDLISRQAAIDAIDEIESEVADGDGFQCEKWKQYFCDLPSADIDLSDYSDRLWRNAYERGKADAQPRWIPVTERLPEYGDKVLVTFHNKYIDRTTIGVSCCYVQKEGFFSDTPFDYAPIAWMPLPEPYERSEDAEID